MSPLIFVWLISGKTKNEYFRERVHEVLAWGLQPTWITGDSWYAGLDNLKCVKHHTLSFMFAVERNRLVSVEKGTSVQIQSLEVPVSGLKVYLKGFGFVKIFRTVFFENTAIILCTHLRPKRLIT